MREIEVQCIIIRCGDGMNVRGFKLNVTWINAHDRYHDPREEFQYYTTLVVVVGCLS